MTTLLEEDMEPWGSRRPRLTPQQELDLVMNHGANIAHEGKLIPSQCWRLRKVDSIKLKEDGSNFFHVATKYR